MIAAFFVIMSLSAGITGYLTARNESGLAQSESTNPQIKSVDLYESGVSEGTIVLEVGQTVQVNNKSGFDRGLSLGSGNAGHTAEQGDENLTENHEETEDDVHEDKSQNHEESHYTHDHTEGFSSGLFGPDEAWRATFKEPGTYFLHDHANPEVNILVVVYESNK